MQHETITFQLATHYLPKIALRLEYLYQTVQDACHETHPVIHHYALKNIIEIIKIIERPELKSRFLKELIRIEHMLIKSEKKVSGVLLDNLFVQIQLLNYVAGRFGESIHNDPFLQSIRLSQTTQDNDCELHSPQLLLWLEVSPDRRQQDLTVWLKQLRSLHDTVNLYLSLLRDTAEFDKINMFNGFYQRSLPPKTSCHLILLRIDKASGCVPRMQLGHHGLSLKLCNASTMREIHGVNIDVDLAVCQL